MCFQRPRHENSGRSRPLLACSREEQVMIPMQRASSFFVSVVSDFGLAVQRDSRPTVAVAVWPNGRWADGLSQLSQCRSSIWSVSVRTYSCSSQHPELWDKDTHTLQLCDCKNKSELSDFQTSRLATSFHSSSRHRHRHRHFHFASLP